ncbi:MAG: metallophosphoesterase family protein [Pirellulales bacterium]
MRKLVHISDLHFGRVDTATVEPLRAAISAVGPDVVVVSGDLTQRAREEEYQAAAQFLAGLPTPQIVVPGNHDVPLYDVLRRFLRPLGRYRKYVSAETEPHYADDEIVIQGLNTARSFTFKNGRLNRGQIEKVRRRFAAAPRRAVRVLVTHHPLDLPSTYERHDLVGRAALAMPVLAECGADLLLAGHFHQAHAGDTSQRYAISRFAALVVQAGTTTSTRRRDEPNSFNFISCCSDDITVDRYTWREAESVFASALTEHFRRTPDGRRRAPVEQASPAPVEVPVATT